MYQFLKVELRSHLAWIYLNRPDKRNALNPEMIAELETVFSQLPKSRDIKAVILSGSGKAFCAGADLAYLKDISRFSEKENLDDSRKLGNLFLRIYQLPLITVAMVNGPALAGGCGLASVCDFIIASQERARFGYTEARIGFIPALVANFLFRKVNPATALDLLVTARIIDAREARELGLVYKVVPDAELKLQTETFLQSLLSANSFNSMVKTKLLFQQLLELPLRKGLKVAAETNAAFRNTADCQMGIIAFLEKRTINWREK